MRRIIISVLAVLFATTTAHAQKKLWDGLRQATQSYMQHHLWNPSTGNYVLSADRPNSPGSDSWGITIVLDAQAYMVENGLMKPEEMKQYFQTSTLLYDRTNGTTGARILARRGDQIYIGGDDDMQWDAALVHCFEATKDSDYLTAAESSFNGLIAMGFWQNGASKGWSWNSFERRPDGVSTAYGALAAARLYKVTHEDVYKQWTTASLNALYTPQVGYFPRDRMVAADAALTAFEASHDPAFHKRAMELLDSAIAGGLFRLHHDEPQEHRNPTDIGDLADGLFHFYDVTHNAKYKSLALTFINFFVDHRTLPDIAEHGWYSEYDTKGHPITDGKYLGIPDTVPYFSEVAEMLKLFAIAECSG
ncbi:MAG TPA: hypothetical protein VFH95_16020 [Candidatus Kapabacteria bacterium]|nr:hypothetical protein [Candidatus Kapabacteria bacterium]